MGMTMTQKILAKHAGLESVTAGQLIEANVDLTLANDITGPVAIREMEKAGFDKVFDNTKIALVMDHFAPNKDIKSAEQCLECREFCQEVQHRKLLRRWRNGYRARAAAGKRSDRSR